MSIVFVLNMVYSEKPLVDILRMLEILVILFLRLIHGIKFLFNAVVYKEKLHEYAYLKYLFKFLAYH